jgi:hypothetical protein
MSDEPRKFKLLTDAEVADVLRCKPAKVRRLRLSGKLPYLRGRPSMTLESDLEAYVERERKIKSAGIPGSPEFAAMEALEFERRGKAAWKKFHARMARRRLSKLKG